MKPHQKELLLKLAKTISDISEECINDDAFHEILISNNDLFPMSLGDLACEWYSVAHEERESE
jgi:hypothetical protein